MDYESTTRVSGISIHAPRVGSDDVAFASEVTSGGFLSTLPAWGATCRRYRPCLLIPISIHAPRVGSDSSKFTVTGVSGSFLSTLPAWGATWP